jgi:ATP-binding cassette subfamily B multidrug efflux pump
LYTDAGYLPEKQKTRHPGGSENHDVLWKLIARFLRPHWSLISAVAVLQILQSMASLYLPELSAEIINRGVATGDTGFILTTGGVMLVVAFAQIACSFAAVYFSARTAMAVGRDLRFAVFDHVGAFSEQEVSRFGAPSLITRTTNDVQQVQTLVLTTCTMLISAPILSIGGIVMAIRLDPTLSRLIAVSVPLMMVGLGLIMARMLPLYRTMQVKIDGVNRVLREQLTGIRVVRAFVREDLETRRFAAANRDVTDVNLRAGRLMALMFPVIMIVLNVSSVAVIWFGAFRIESGSMQVGTLIAFLTYLMQILMAVMMATFILTMIPRAAVSAERIQEVLATQSSVRPPDAPVTPATSQGRVELRAVGFSYPGAEEPVVTEVSFVAEPGQTVALIGSTGSGKSTLVNLIPRLFDVTSGAVLIDGVDIRELAPETLWGGMGLVPQKPFLFSGTVRSNLLQGKPDASDEVLWRALDIAQARDFVEQMQGGLDARIAQGGANVSGGQRQRLAIARALVRRPRVYLFDDSFSALDTATEARLRQALKAHTGNATLIIVAQRVSSIADADQILVLEKGRIVARGTHRELLASSPTYREIVASQSSEEEAA